MRDGASGLDRLRPIERRDRVYGVAAWQQPSKSAVTIDVWAGTDWHKRYADGVHGKLEFFCNKMVRLFKVPKAGLNIDRTRQVCKNIVY